MKNTMNRTRDDIKNYLRSRISPWMTGRIMNVIGEFNTIEGFLNASKSELDAAHCRLSSDNNKRDLGRRFFEAQQLVCIYCAEDCEKKHAAAPLRQEKLVMSRQSLKNALRFMDTFDLQEIDILKLRDFLASAGVSMDAEINPGWEDPLK